MNCVLPGGLFFLLILSVEFHPDLIISWRRRGSHVDVVPSRIIFLPVGGVEAHTLMLFRLNLYLLTVEGVEAPKWSVPSCLMSVDKVGGVEARTSGVPSHSPSLLNS